MAIEGAEFEREQEHLRQTYATLLKIERETTARIEARGEAAAADHEEMLEGIVHDYDNGTNLEAYAEIEAMQRVIDSYNFANRIDGERLTRARTLLKRPYFAKVSLRFKPGAAPRDVYLGVAGMANDLHRQIIVDWRSPVAEAYYSQSTGAVSYRTDDGRTITADLTCRRQFDIERDRLNAAFDTSVAIEDPLLLQSLARERTDKLADITATIQREQNAVVRHEDVPVLLVNGIAGSGKTSVLLQRIAYLFFRERETLDPRDVYLITPNPVFRAYIDDVLPSMGERNPHIVTWNDLTARLGLGDRGHAAEDAASSLRRIDEALAAFELEDRDFQDILVGEERVVAASQAASIYRRFARLPHGPHRSALVAEELAEKLAARVKRLAKNEAVQLQLDDLTDEEQLRIFGGPLIVTDEREIPAFTARMLRDRYAQVYDRIEDGEWLRIDRIGMRLLGRSSLSAEEWLYVKLTLAGGANRSARYCLIDEVQDYTQAQLMLLARYFCNAHFLLLGDPNQAIHPGTASFAQVKAIFTEARGDVRECRLLTSYRSTREITALFTSLMPADDAVKVTSVRRSGAAPRIEAFEHGAAYDAALVDAARTARARTGEEGETLLLAAVLAPDAHGVRATARLLGEAQVPFTLLDGKTALPREGLVLADVASAKGLEFDEVIVACASARSYPDDALSRCRLYTAVSRATKRVSVLADGPLTPLLV